MNPFEIKFSNKSYFIWVLNGNPLNVGHDKQYTSYEPKFTILHKTQLHFRITTGNLFQSNLQKIKL